MSMSDIQRIIYMYEADEISRRDAYESIKDIAEQCIEGMGDDLNE